METNEIRRANLTRLAEQQFSSQRALADAVGRTPGYINQLVTGHRDMGEKMARHIETRLGLPKLSLDDPGLSPGTVTGQSALPRETPSREAAAFLEAMAHLLPEQVEDVLRLAAHNRKVMALGQKADQASPERERERERERARTAPNRPEGWKRPETYLDLLQENRRQQEERRKAEGDETRWPGRRKENGR